MPLRPAYNVANDGSLEIVDRIARQCAKKYYTDRGQAEDVAKDLAEKNPSIQFVVFEPSVIYEVLPPPPPPPPPPVKLLKKRITESGEIVLDKDEE
jgi:hypothetical protein